MKINIFFICCFFQAATLLAQTNNANRKLIWADEFDYSGLPDDTKWGYEKGFVRNKEPQYYTEKRLENAFVDNGKLVITARKEDYQGAKFTSASLITLKKMHLQYGRVEVRAKVYKGVGGWPAIWMLGTNRGPVKWPNCGEIDILEYVGKDSTQIYGTVHYADSLNQYATEGNKPKVGEPHNDFHVYAIDWNKDRIEFYYDNLKYFVFDLSKADNNKEGNPFRKEFYLLINLALGREGTLAGPLNESILPLKYEIDYVRIYK